MSHFFLVVSVTLLFLLSLILSFLGKHGGACGVDLRVCQ